MAKPFLRWAGGKRLLLPEIIPHLPTFGPETTYYEPFVGGGALFFELEPDRAVLSDINEDLIHAFETVKCDVEGVIGALRRLRKGEDAYYRTRSSRPRTDATRAARFIYLNKNCFNGLYRVNKAGAFNTPFGRPGPNYVLCDANQLRSASRALQAATLRCCNFADAVEGAQSGDFVYFDPPYTTAHQNNGFIEYNAQVFSWTHQAALASLAKLLTERGVHVIVSNASHQSILELYEHASFRNVTRIDRHSTIAASATKRFKTQELLLVGAPRKGGENG